MRFKLIMYMLAISCLGPVAARAGGPVAGIHDTLGPRFAASAHALQPPARHPPPAGADPVRRLLFWNEQALDANALDHTPPTGSEVRGYGEQAGPARSTRALAIVQLAVYDAVNALVGGMPGYSGITAAAPGASLDAAIAQAAHDSLAALYPAQAHRLDALLAADLARLPGGRAKQDGVDLGRRAAAAILALRANDESQYPEPRIGVDFFPSDAPGKWRPDPISQSPVALGAHWGAVHPFVLDSSQQFRPPPPPALASAAYTSAFNEVKRLGGDGIGTPTRRSADQTAAGIYWAYDGTARVGTPPRLYNQIAAQLAQRKGSDAGALARLLALVNVAMADSCMVTWEAKYEYQFWRPVTGIREADEGSGPTGLGDGNPDTRGDPGWTPLGSPASNLSGPNFTPPFPAYPSGHAALGGALFETLRRFYASDAIAFTFVSDEYNGVTRDNQGHVRPRRPRSFASLSQAEEENGQSRVYLGVHWAFDKTAADALGRQVADYVFLRGLVQPAK